MEKFKIISVLTLVALLSLPFTSGAANRTADKAAAASVIAAKVTDTGGQPVQGATITAMEGRYVAQSGPDGSFKVQSGTADYVLVEASGFASQTVPVPDLKKSGVVVMQRENYMEGKDDQVNVAFGTQSKRRIVGAVSNIRMDDYKDKYNDRNFWTLVGATGLGMFSPTDVRGSGSTIVIDGLVRNDEGAIAQLSDMLNSDEIEQITVLKDPTSKMLYGSLADKGIIMVKTRRGEAFQRKMNFSYEAGFGVPISYPNYLKAADYMTLYNEARQNDGLTPTYSASDIQNTRQGVDPIKYPDVDYYRGNEFLKSARPQQSFQGEFIGGNATAQYYLNLNYMNQQSLLKNGQGSKQSTNRFNVHGAVDMKVNSFIKATIDGTAIFNAYHGPHYMGKNFWNLTTSERVNAYPLLIPIDRIRPDDSPIVDEARGDRSIINGAYLVGGDAGFDQNNHQNIYGDLNLGGYENTMDRLMNANIGLDIDLKSITNGLGFRTYFGTDNYNKYTATQANAYAIYSPTVQNDGTIAITKVGNNNFVGNQSMNGVSFSRRYGWTNSLDYDRIFGGLHDLSAQLTSILYTYKESDTPYTDRNMNFGLRANYMYNRRYVAEYSAALVGSSYLSRSNRWGYAQALGAAWIMSEENFLHSVRQIDYLKLKASWGNTKTDRDAAFNSYHLYENSFTSGANYSYGDAAGQNAMMNYAAGNPDLSFIQRSEMNAGVEASLLKHSIFVEANYFNSLRYDIVDSLNNVSPAYMGGGNFISYQNYGRMREQGFELGVNYRRKFGQVEVGAGLNAIWYSPKTLRTDEENYGPGMDYRQQAGKSPYAVWGLEADGLYTQAEVDKINAHDPSIAFPTYGVVRAGDIKYRDLNGDGKIDDNDLTVIGSSHPKAAYALTLDVTWRNFTLWAYFSASTGVKTVDGSNAANDYYWVNGEMKYPTHILDRWTSDNPDVNAAYPRLTVSETGNNYRNSTFWVSNKNYVSMPALQLTYTFGKRISNALDMKKAMVFVRAQNLFTVGPNADILQLNVGSEPQQRWYYIGVKAEF